MMMKNLEDRNKIQGDPDCLENMSIRMEPILDKCWVVYTGTSIHITREFERHYRSLGESKE